MNLLHMYVHSGRFLVPSMTRHIDQNNHFLYRDVYNYYYISSICIYSRLDIDSTYLYNSRKQRCMYGTIALSLAVAGPSQRFSLPGI